MRSTSTLVVMDATDEKARTPFARRVRKALALADLSQSALARRLSERIGREVKPQTIQHSATNAEASELTGDIAAICGVNYDWLAHGNGEMFTYDEATVLSEPSADYKKPTSEWVYVDQVMDAHLSAGGGEVLWDFDIVAGKRAFERAWMQAEGLRAERCKLWKVRGDSMWPEFSDGDSVLVNMGDREVVSGNVYALIGEDGLRIKRLYKRDGYIEMRSDNPQQHVYPPERVIDNNYGIIGLVVWKAGKISKKRG